MYALKYQNNFDERIYDGLIFFLQFLD